MGEAPVPSGSERRTQCGGVGDGRAVSWTLIGCVWQTTPAEGGMVWQARLYLRLDIRVEAVEVAAVVVAVVVA